jgi:hypothetical protein
MALPLIKENPLGERAIGPSPKPPIPFHPSFGVNASATPFMQ